MKPEPYNASLYQMVASGLAGRLDAVLADILPGGRIAGAEYVCASLSGGSGHSCKTNIVTGKGSDFATGETWGDIIGLVQRLRNAKAREAALWLAERYGIPIEQPAKTHSRHASDTIWEIVCPIPPNAPPRLERHKAYGVPVAWWEYRDRDDRLLHYVARFETPSGKAVLPQCLFGNERGELAWIWKHMPGSRPLYGLDRLAAMPPDSPVLLVEGEKTVDAAQKRFPGHVCMTWSGSGGVPSPAAAARLFAGQVGFGGCAAGGIRPVSLSRPCGDAVHPPDRRCS